MPVVEISMLPQSVEKKAEMYKVITDEIHRITEIPKEAIIIMFNELPADNFGTGGEMLSKRLKGNN